MKKKPFSKSWVVIDHPQQLIIAIWISRILKKEFGQKANLIISKHAYWEWLKFGEYRKEFSLVKWFDRLDYPPPSLSLYLQFAASLLLIPRLYAMSLFVKSLDIGESDIILGLSTQQFLENKIISYYRKTKRIGILTLTTYINSRKKPFRKNHEFSLGSFIVRYLQLIMGMYEVVCTYKRRIGPKKDGDTVQRYIKPLTQLYDVLMVMENCGVKLRNNAITKIVHTKYPYTINLGNVAEKKRKQVIFLGEPILKTQNLDMDIKLKLVNKCLGYVRKHYGGKYDLVYKPHPSFSSELAVLNLNGFTIYNDTIPAEIFFVKNRTSIHAVYSVCSTASRSALNCGLPSYVFYKVFPFEASVEIDWINLLGKMPENSIVTGFDQKPRKIDMPDWKNDHIVFKDHLVAAIRSLVV